MTIKKTAISNCFILEPTLHHDERGYFLESYNRRVFETAIQLSPHFVQDNESQSSYGVIRGLHAQKKPFAQAKLVRVVKGKVLDVVVDARLGSPSFGKVVSVVLDGKAKNQLFVPKGCLHGFSVLEDNTVFSYKCDAFYDKSSEIGVDPLDPALAIDWQVKPGCELISEKDKSLMGWESFKARP